MNSSRAAASSLSRRYKYSLQGLCLYQSAGLIKIRVLNGFFSVVSMSFTEHRAIVTVYTWPGFTLKVPLKHPWCSIKRFDL